MFFFVVFVLRVGLTLHFLQLNLILTQCISPPIEYMIIHACELFQLLFEYWKHNTHEDLWLASISIGFVDFCMVHRVQELISVRKHFKNMY